MHLNALQWLKNNYKEYYISRTIINKLKVSSSFWRYRHLIDWKFASGYAEDSKNQRRNYYSDIVNKYSLKVIFEFGCASGPNLKNIKDNTSGDINLIGYDINSSAINLAKKTFDKRKSIFFTELKLSKIENHLKTINHDKIDLIIFDRVLYLLSEKQIRNHLNLYKHLYRYIIIDDFHSAKGVISNGTYFTKNYLDLFSDFNVISIDNSGHNVSSEFFKLSAKRILLCNK